MAVHIQSVEAGSPAAGAGIRAGDALLSIDGRDITDYFDYRYCLEEERIALSLERGGRRYSVEIDKPAGEDIGLAFETFLMSAERSCANRCVFCFIDQLPSGLRDTLYFKDDDARLSFLFGNYITLTNLSRRDVDRIIEMRIQPINISVHTTDPELRCRMMGHPRAGESLRVLDEFAAAGLMMGGQIVVCPGYNDGPTLERTLSDLYRFAPAMRSVSVVPVGLTAHREGLPPLRPVDREAATAILDIVERWGERAKRETGSRFVFAADEIYLAAGRAIPPPEHYEDFPQIDNGVGMLRQFEEAFCGALDRTPPPRLPMRATVATGALAAPELRRLVDELQARWHNQFVNVVAVENRLFGPGVTVSGLLAGRDVIAALRGRVRGHLLLPANLLDRAGERFLDDVTPRELERALGVPVTFCDGGADVVGALARERLTGRARGARRRGAK